MKKGVTELVFILDRSSSIGGFNSVLTKQKAEEGEAKITTVLFDDRHELLHDRFNLHKITQITEKEYFVRGTTALLDAIGKTILMKSQSEKTRKKDKEHGQDIT